MLNNLYIVEQMLESENSEYTLSLWNDSKSLMSPNNIHKTYTVLVIRRLHREDRKAEEDLINL